MEQRHTTWLLWTLGGCGVLLLLGICVLAGIGAWLALEERQAEPLPEPPLGPDPVPTPGPPEPAPGSGPAPGAGPPIVVRATVASVSGSQPVSEGTTCGFTIERHERGDGSYWCRTQVVCAGRLLYGGRDAGYFPCTFFVGDPPGVVGGEGETTSQDGDASFAVDTRSGMVRIADDQSGLHGAYALEAKVDRVR